MNWKLKLQIGILIVVGIMVGFASGVYATSVFIGNFIDLGK